MAGDQGPLIAILILHAEEGIFLLMGPFLIADVLIKVVVISAVSIFSTSSGIAFRFCPQSKTTFASPTKYGPIWSSLSLR